MTELKLCACGCNQEIPELHTGGKPQTYVYSHYWIGKKHKIETKRKMRERALGRKHKLETIEKMKISKRKYQREMVYCACGCGTRFLNFNHLNRRRRYVKGHTWGGKSPLHVINRNLTNNPAWRPEVKEKLRQFNLKPRFLIACKCGCGQQLMNRTRWGERKYIKGHYPRCTKCGKLLGINHSCEYPIKAILKGLMKRPTSLERQFIDICTKYNLPYKYVGNGSFLIGQRNPDFINVNGEKICIEVANTIHHSEEYPQKRIEYFKKFGWDCIVFRTNKLSEEVIKNVLAN